MERHFGQTRIRLIHFPGKRETGPSFRCAMEKLWCPGKSSGMGLGGLEPASLQGCRHITELLQHLAPQSERRKQHSIISKVLSAMSPFLVKVVTVQYRSKTTDISFPTGLLHHSRRISVTGHHTGGLRNTGVKAPFPNLIQSHHFGGHPRQDHRTVLDPFLGLAVSFPLSNTEVNILRHALSPNSIS